MPSTRMCVATILAIALAAAPLRGAERFQVTLPIGDQLQLDLPPGWQATSEVTGPSVTVRITSPPTEPFLVLLSTLPLEPGSPASTPEGLRKVVTEVGNRALVGATQDRLELSEVGNPTGVGFAYHFTDRNPERGPGDYREAHQGSLLIDKTMITFTILTHSGDQETVDRAKRLLTTLRVVTSASKS